MKALLSERWLNRALRLLAVGAMVAAGFTATSCSLSNINADSCEIDDACVLAFGLGSSCNDGFCTAAASCTTGHDCRKQFGGGACVNNTCIDELPANDSCYVFEPDELPNTRLTGQDSPLLLGAIFSLGGPEGGRAFDMGQVAAVRVALREINRSGAGNNGRKFGMVFCDNDGPDNDFVDTERDNANRAALDYLSGVLGVPAMVGPLSSADATTLIGHMLANQYPTLMMSSSATSPSLTDEPDRLDPTDTYGLFWRSCPSDSLQGKVLAENVIGTDTNINKVVVIYIADSYGEGLLQVFTDNYLAGDMGRVVQPRPFDTGDDFDVLAAQVQGDAPDGILIISVNASETVEILTGLAGAGQAAIPYFFTDGSKDKTVMLDDMTLSAEVKQMIQGALGTGPPSPVANSNYQQFDASLFKDFGINGTDFSFLANSYDAGYLVAMGAVFASSGTMNYDGRDVAAGYSRVILGDNITVGASSWGSVKAALTNGDSFNLDGISGSLDFVVANGEAPGPIEIWRVNAAGTEFEAELTIFP